MNQTELDALIDPRPKEVRLIYNSYDGWIWKLKFEHGPFITTLSGWFLNRITKGEVIFAFEKQGYTNIQTS